MHATHILTSNLHIYKIKYANDIIILMQYHHWHSIYKRNIALSSQFLFLCSFNMHAKKLVQNKKIINNYIRKKL
jgi:hypothetical protein